MNTPEAIARRFHEEYERRASDHGWTTQERSRKAWENIPEENRSLMMAVVTALLINGTIGMVRDGDVKLLLDELKTYHDASWDHNLGDDPRGCSSCDLAVCVRGVYGP